MVVAHPLEQPPQLLDLAGRVEGLDRRLVRARAPPALALGILRLEMSRVAEDEIRQIDRRGRRVDRLGVPEARQQGQPPRVIEMRVREDDGVELLEGAALGQPVVVLLLLASLEQAAVDQDVGHLRLKEIRRTGRPCSAPLRCWPALEGGRALSAQEKRSRAVPDGVTSFRRIRCTPRYDPPGPGLPRA
jgi:hypothetical protein